jgi:hypothetical protein
MKKLHPSLYLRGPYRNRSPGSCWRTISGRFEPGRLLVGVFVVFAAGAALVLATVFALSSAGS